MLRLVSNSRGHGKLIEEVVIKVSFACLVRSDSIRDELLIVCGMFNVEIGVSKGKGS